MDKLELTSKLSIKQHELNLTQDPEKRQKIQKEIQILNHKIQIERIKEIIRKLQDN